MRWTAPPKAGKTALLADFVLRPPAGTVVALRSQYGEEETARSLDHLIVHYSGQNQRWFGPLWQGQVITVAPLYVAAPATSRQSPDPEFQIA